MMCIHAHPIEADARGFARVVRNVVCGQRDCPDRPAGQHSAQHAARVAHASHQELPLILQKEALGGLEQNRWRQCLTTGSHAIPYRPSFFTDPCEHNPKPIQTLVSTSCLKGLLSPAFCPLTGSLYA